jgi:NADH-quinone oxidoreductase subunit A
MPTSPTIPASLPAAPLQGELVPLIAYTAVAVLLIGVLLLAAWWLGARRRSDVKGEAYESGVSPTGTARLAYPVPFYLIAIFFIVFDVEAVFIFAWAVVWDDLGLPGLIHISFFIIVLLLGLIWLWLKGGLDWGPSRAQFKDADGN